MTYLTETDIEHQAMNCLESRIPFDSWVKSKGFSQEDAELIKQDSQMNTFERLSALEHEQWAHWTKYMLDNLTPENIARWRKQIDTPYGKLSEKEKDSDRTWAKKVLVVEVDSGKKVEHATCPKWSIEVDCDRKCPKDMDKGFCYNTRPENIGEIIERMKNES